MEKPVRMKTLLIQIPVRAKTHVTTNTCIGNNYLVKHLIIEILFLMKVSLSEKHMFKGKSLMETLARMKTSESENTRIQKHVCLTGTPLNETSVRVKHLFYIHRSIGCSCENYYL